MVTRTKLDATSGTSATESAVSPRASISSCSAHVGQFGFASTWVCLPCGCWSTCCFRRPLESHKNSISDRLPLIAILRRPSISSFSARALQFGFVSTWACLPCGWLSTCCFRRKHSTSDRLPRGFGVFTLSPPSNLPKSRR